MTLFEKVKELLPSKQRVEKPDKYAVVKRKTDVHVDHSINKKIKLFENGVVTETVPYSDVKVQQLREQGYRFPKGTQIVEDDKETKIYTEENPGVIIN